MKCDGNLVECDSAQLITGRTAHILQTQPTIDKIQVVASAHSTITRPRQRLKQVPRRRQQQERQEATIDNEKKGLINMADETSERSFRGCRAYLCSGDFVEFACCLTLFIVSAGFGAAHLEPFQRPLPVQLLENSGDYVRNLMFDQPMNDETVPNEAVVVIGMWLPLILQMLIASCKGWRGDCHRTICVYLVALALTGLATEAIKVYVGYFRPIFFSVCDPTQDYSACQEAYDDDARKSFLSGHSSLSFAGLGQLFLYIHTRWGVPSVTTSKALDHGDEEVVYSTDEASRRQIARMRTARLCSILALLPLGLAAFIACSRIVDNRHHPVDVVGGSVLGGALTVFVQGLWFTQP
jgi:diacylglycerol diphosphate phosphatase / phosphatidate phosphatase